MFITSSNKNLIVCAGNINVVRYNIGEDMIYLLDRFNYVCYLINVGIKCISIDSKFLFISFHFHRY